MKKLTLENILSKMPADLAADLQDFNIQKDDNGMSPAQVFFLSQEELAYYLKVSHKTLRTTTYDVIREGQVLSWLEGKLAVPKVLYMASHGDYDFLLMDQAEGQCLDYSPVGPADRVEAYVAAIRQLERVDTRTCPFDSSLDYRLDELDILCEKGLLAEKDFYEEDLPFESPSDLVAYLKANKPDQDLVFSHGDLSDGNIFLGPDRAIRGYIDWGRGGLADRWYDIALIIRNIREDFEDEAYVDQFLKGLGIVPDWPRINYYMYLDTLF